MCLKITELYTDTVGPLVPMLMTGINLGAGEARQRKRHADHVAWRGNGSATYVITDLLKSLI